MPIFGIWLYYGQSWLIAPSPYQITYQNNGNPVACRSERYNFTNPGKHIQHGLGITLLIRRQEQLEYLMLTRNIHIWRHLPASDVMASASFFRFRWTIFFRAGMLGRWLDTVSDTLQRESPTMWWGVAVRFWEATILIWFFKLYAPTCPVEGKWLWGRAYSRVAKEDIPVVTAVALHCVPLSRCALLYRSHLHATFPLARSLWQTYVYPLCSSFSLPLTDSINSTLEELEGKEGWGWVDGGGWGWL